jgi:hypothetical protein
MADTGNGDLVRRVPGAQMPVGARGARPESTTPASADGAQHDPAGPDPADEAAAAARSLVEEFEAGVQRALLLGDDRGAAGTAGTDEEDAR